MKKGKLSRSEAKRALEELNVNTDFSDGWKKYSDGGFIDYPCKLV